jgi:hypothetical protein
VGAIRGSSDESNTTGCSFCHQIETEPQDINFVQESIVSSALLDAVDLAAMSVDPSQAMETFAPQGQTRRRRRRHSHRSLKHHTAGRRLQRGLLLLSLGAVVIAASLYFAQRFTAYQPPPALVD